VNVALLRPDPGVPGHSTGMVPAIESAAKIEHRSQPELCCRQEKELSTFGDIYEEYFDFVWRSAKRLGVHETYLDDAVQDVFLTVHRRLNEFQGRSTIKTWLFGILLNKVRGYRRTAKRKPFFALTNENVADPANVGPLEIRAKTEAAELLHRLLDSLDDDKREVFVLAELEQMTAEEIAESMGIKSHTVYSRLRAARREFESALTRHQARDRWRLK
jgi:RNA polymerase sigma-70 factor (ECF subfamily)